MPYFHPHCQVGDTDMYIKNYVAIWVVSDSKEHDSAAGESATWYPARITGFRKSGDGQTLTHVKVRWYGNSASEFRDGKILPGWMDNMGRYVYQKTCKRHGAKPYVTEVFIESVLTWGLRVTGGEITTESLARIDDAVKATMDRQAEGLE